MNSQTRKLCILSMLAALAYLVMAVARIPITSVEFLKYDPKDVVIAIGGFIYGPMSAFLISLVVSLIEMVTVSTTGFIGMVMNVISSCGLVCTAAIIYGKNRTLKGAVIGLIAGGLVATALMLLWNYLITPLYMGTPREVVAGMLLPVFLPFNLLKSGINIALTMLLYNPMVTLLRRMGLMEASVKKPGSAKKISLGVTLVSLVSLATLILVVLVTRGVL